MLWVPGPGAWADELNVGAGASVDLGTASIDLGCADLTVTGTFSSGSVGFAAARDVTIEPTGVLNGNSATLEVAGNWANGGVFTCGASTVSFVDGCGLTTATITGDTTFCGLEMATGIGKVYAFEAGSTQTITDSLTLAGASGNLLTIRSTIDGLEAFTNLLGSQSIDFVDVKDNHAVGSPLALPANSVDSGNTQGWVPSVPIPVLVPLGVALLLIALLLAGRGPLPDASRTAST